MLLRVLLWTLLYLVSLGTSERITTYFLNSDYSLYNPLPSDITLCYRLQPMMYNGIDYYWPTIIGFGNIRSDFTDMDEGFAFGTWESGPWMGVKNRTNTNYAWVSLGPKFMHDVQIWRHTCLSMNFYTGHVKLFENGKERYRTQSDLIQKQEQWMNHVSVGCMYKSTGETEYMSMYGRVTYVQVFGNILIDTKMEEITECGSRHEGDLLCWNFTKWVRSGVKKNIRKESLDWDSVIRRSVNESYHVMLWRQNLA